MSSDCNLESVSMHVARRSMVITSRVFFYLGLFAVPSQGAGLSSTILPYYCNADGRIGSAYWASRFGTDPYYLSRYCAAVRADGASYRQASNPQKYQQALLEALRGYVDVERGAKESFRMISRRTHL